MYRKVILGIMSAAILVIALYTAPPQASAVQPQQIMGNAVKFWLNYSDPASDVAWEYPNGTKELKDNPEDVNIKWLRSADLDNRIQLTVELKKPGLVNTTKNAYYQINIYTNNTKNDTHYVVKYSGSNCTLCTNTSTTIINDTLEFSVDNTGSGGKLYINVSKKNIKNVWGKIDYYNIDAVASKKNGVMRYTDYGWMVPGNPGSTPTPQPSNGGWQDGGLIMLVVLLLIGLIIAVIIVIVYRQKRKKEKEQKEERPPSAPK